MRQHLARLAVLALLLAAPTPSGAQTAAIQQKLEIRLAVHRAVAPVYSLFRRILSAAPTEGEKPKDVSNPQVGK